MKYMLLTKEQLETLHQDFAKFLASQQIDSKEWAHIKKNKPEVVSEELELFSDLVWDDVLTKTRYLEHFSTTQIDLFKCGAKSAHRIVVRVAKPNFNFFEKADYQWFLNNPTHKDISYLQALKNYESERNLEIFNFIKKGSVISKGDLYKSILIQIK
ncbi:MAG: DUF6495 family protein [Flavobacteriaceae bacterium]|nr:DUF6495 family protein [Flavobacteriaceae bacterium]